MTKYDAIVIGTGQAGPTMATRLAGSGLKTAIIESGKFIGEHGEYPEGTWLRSPHMPKHFSRVEETLIYVKVGFL